MPLIIYGLLAFTGGVLSLTLPETLNKQLPETIEEGEAFGKWVFMWCFVKCFINKLVFRKVKSVPAVPVDVEEIAVLNPTNNKTDESGENKIGNGVSS